MRERKQEKNRIAYFYPDDLVSLPSEWARDSRATPKCKQTKIETAEMNSKEQKSKEKG